MPWWLAIFWLIVVLLAWTLYLMAALIVYLAISLLALGRALARRAWRA
jgi:hypothetical protein